MSRIGRSLAALVLVLGACAPDVESDLRGSMRLSVVSGVGATIAVDGPPGKLRAQLVDDGKGCSLRVLVESADGGLQLSMNTYPDEIPALLSGSTQSLPASSHGDRSIALNAATVYLSFGDQPSWYSTGGTIEIDPLPEPLERLRLQLHAVEMRVASTSETRLLVGTIEATYLGAVSTTGGEHRACPQWPRTPRGVVY